MLVDSHSFLNPRNPSAHCSPLYDIESLALAGKAMKSINVNPVKFPAECLPRLLSFPLL